MPALRRDDALLRLTKEMNQVKAALRKMGGNIPLFDLASENTPAQITANQNNYAIGDYDILRISSDAARTITGLAEGLKGRYLQLFNVGAFTITLSHESASSLAANRFKFSTAADFDIDAGASILLYYDSTQSRWVDAGGGAGGGAAAGGEFWIRGFVTNPQSVYTSRPQIVMFRAESALTITGILVHGNDPTPGGELLGDLKFADDMFTGGFAGATVIQAIDTTNGVFNMYVGFTDATVPAGKYVYIQLDSSPHSDWKDFYIEVFYTLDSGGDASHALRAFATNPQGIYTSRPQIFLGRTDAIFTPTRIHIHGNDSTPTTELAGDLKYADDMFTGGFAGATVIDVCDTTNGVFTATAGFDVASIPAGKYIYFQMDASPHTDWKDFYIEFFYT